MDKQGQKRPLVMADQPLAVRKCSMSAALDLVGERKTLLVVRELGYGVHRFEQIRGFTGAARDVLADRLRKLAAAGLVEKRAYSAHPPRYEYHLTEAGQALHPVLVSLFQWGERWAVDEPPATVLEHACGHHLEAQLVCRHCGQPAGPPTVRAVSVS
jgi:DNA-binding HxlR family transcriptional regulator